MGTFWSGGYVDSTYEQLIGGGGSSYSLRTVLKEGEGEGVGGV